MFAYLFLIGDHYSVIKCHRNFYPLDGIEYELRIALKFTELTSTILILIGAYSSLINLNRSLPVPY